MKLHHLYFALLFLGFQDSHAQQFELKFLLVDESTESPISDAHVFISNSSIGSSSNAAGQCKITLSREEKHSLILSHVSYESLIIEAEDYQHFDDRVIIKMKNNGIDLNEIMVTAKRGAKWNRNFKKFKQTLLGVDIAAAQCKILNPEVLRF